MNLLLYENFSLLVSLAKCSFRFPDDLSIPHDESSNMSLKELNVDPTTMGIGSNCDDTNWWAMDIDPRFPPFDSPDLAFDTSAFGLQNELLSSSSTSTDSGFNQHFPPTFNSPNVTSPAFDFEQFSHPSSSLTDFTSVVPNNIPSFSFPSTVAPAVNAPQPPSQLIGASPFMQFQPTPALVPAFPHTGATLPTIASPFMQFQAPVPAFPHTGALLPNIAPTLVNASPSNASSRTVIPADAPQHIPAASNALSHPTATPISPAPAFPHTGALLPTIAPTPPVNASPSNASSRTVIPADAPQHIPAASNALSHPTATPVSPQHIPATSNALLQPTATATPVSPLPQATAPPVSPQHIPATSNASPHSSTQPAATPGDASSPPPVDSSSVSLNQADGRRSGRNPMPSKRHEQMNEIDGKGNNKATGSAHIEKENIPSTTPEWTIASHEHLLKSDLGEDWTACVGAWFELEQELGYGSLAGAKVCPLFFFSKWIIGFNFV